jgi:aminomethyltransferase
MGYIATPHSKSGTKVNVLVRGKPCEAEVVPMPFVPSSYYKVPGTETKKKPAAK